MSGKYIPPAMRNKGRFQTEESIQKIPSQDDFPAFGSVKPKTAFKPVRSFAVLANEWQEHSDDEKARKETRDIIERREAERRETENQNVFIYRQHEHKANTYDDEYVGCQSNPTDVDDWTTIEKKARRELTTEELYEKKLRMEEEERRLAEDSVWNDSKGDDWDYRDRRAYS
jgi:hypothetical protein